MFATIRIGLILILLNICSSSQSFVAIALKPKSNEEKFVIPPCAFIKVVLYKKKASFLRNCPKMFFARFDIFNDLLFIQHNFFVSI